MTHSEVSELNLNSAEGKMFNAAMAILTTEYEPSMEFGKMFDKVKAWAAQLPDTESPSLTVEQGEEKKYTQSELLKYGRDMANDALKTCLTELQSLKESNAKLVEALNEFINSSGVVAGYAYDIAKAALSENTKND